MKEPPTFQAEDIWWALGLLAAAALIATPFIIIFT